MKLSFKGLTGAAAVLAAALGLSVVGPHRAYAAPGSITVPGDSDVGVTILSPDPHTPLSGLKPVEISAFYQGSPANQIVAVELYLDGVKAATKTLDLPETRGVVSFLVDASQISVGTHKIVIRATAADQEVKSVRSSFMFGADNGSQPLFVPPTSVTGPTLGRPSGSDGEVPTLHLYDPSESGKVQGVVTIKLQATDPSGKAPYVSLFIDKTFKTLRNFAPYEFEWDTTAYSNGYHTIEAYGYNEAGNSGTAKSLRLYVNNPGGETSIRHDLLDAPKPKKSLGRPLPLRRPDVVTAAQPSAAKATPRIASVLPAHLLSTRESVQMLVRGAGAIRFDALGPATELTTPFVSESPSAPATLETAAPQITKAARVGAAPRRRYKPMAAAIAAPDTDTAPRISGKIAHVQQLATIRMPENNLSLPFLAAPHLAPSTIRPEVKSVMKMHPLRVHLPTNLGSLLRSVGQTSVLFNHTTVKLDRPLTEQNSVLFGPLRQIFEQGGGTLTWQSRTGTVHAKNATKDILLTIGTSQAVVNAKQVTLDGKPYLIMGRTMVPMSFVTAAMDADVQYDAATGHLLITSRK